jgi:rhamnulose-1-phosphate aldolase
MDTTELNAELQRIVDDISDVSQYIWESGWSAANGGNLSVDVTDTVTEGDFPSTDATPLALPVVAPALAGRSLFVTASGSRFRDVRRNPEKSLLLLRVSSDGSGYEVLWGGDGGSGKPTLEFIPHLKVHEHLRSRELPQRVVLHTHPVHLIAMTHLPEYRNPDFERVLQTSQTTARVFLGEGVGMAKYMVMGSEQLADRTVDLLRGRRAVIWERHGCLAIGRDVFEAFDVTDLLEKAAQVFLICVTSGYEPKRMSPDEITALGG